MASEAEWGFMSRADERFIALLARAVSEAMPDAEGWSGFSVRLTLKDGEVIEGIPESLSSNAENAPAFFNSPLDPIARDRLGPVEVTITIDGKTVLAQEVRAFSVELPGG